MIEKVATVLPLPVQGAVTPVPRDLDLRELIPLGATIDEAISYEDDVWDFTGYPFVNQTVKELDFGSLPHRWRRVIKDWALLRMNPSLAATGKSGLNTDAAMARAAAAERPLRATSLVAYIQSFAVTLPVLEAIETTQLGPEHWQLFAANLRKRLPDVAPQTLAGYVRPLTQLWSVREVLRLPELFGGRPFGGNTVESVFKVPPRDRNVERPAPELCGPLLGLSLWILDNCADDILTRLERLSQIPDLRQQSRSIQHQATLEQLEKWAETGRPIPATVSPRKAEAGYELSPSWATFVKLAGASNNSLRNPYGAAGQLFRELIRTRGLSADEDGFALPLRHVPTLDGGSRPWADSLVASRFGLGLEHWVSALSYACAYVVAQLTTVRDREMAALPDDCLRNDTYDRGDIDVPVTRMRGFLVKNRTEPARATWIVGDDVVKAVTVVHQLKGLLRLEPRRHPQTGEPVLFHPELGRGPHGHRAETLQLDGPYLTRFRSSAAFLSSRGVIPELPDLPEWLAHRTIRITGIEAYANQAWGDALAAAQGHWSNRTVAEGYYGHLPNTVFIADPDSVEEVRQIATAQSLLDIASDAGKAPLESIVRGAGVDRLDQVLTATAAYQLANEPVTGRQLLSLAKSATNVFVGQMTVCIHGPGGLCGNAEEADFRLCRPIACRNSATTFAQRAKLELRRRSLRNLGGVYARAQRKIEVDAPNLAAEFVDYDDKRLRALAISDLPGRFADAASTGVEHGK